MINYREILIKYIDIVGEAEGVSFIYHHPSLSNEEFKALEECEEEHDRRYKDSQ